MVMTIVYFIIALFILVTVHEYGHFLVARLCGVKVLRFSFGFGKVLLRCHDRHNTEYVWSVLPLGGYVKMLDEEEGSVLANERHLAFNNKPLWSRIAIVVAGPLFNFLFAFVALWLVLIIGIHSLAPIIETVRPHSPAAGAGFKAKDEIISLNGKSITSWRDFQYAMMPLIGSDESTRVTVKSIDSQQTRTLNLQLSAWHLDGKKPDLLGSLGLSPFLPVIPPVVGEVVPESPAKKAGLQENDRILTMNGKTLEDWLVLVNYVKANPDKPVSLGILRDKRQMTLSVTTGSKGDGSEKEGFLGLRSQKVDWPYKWLRYQHQEPLPAIGTAFWQTIELTGATFSLIGRFVSGKLALQNLGGPVGIAAGAGESARGGLASYLAFLAIVSISLGALNLLPIPMLDGGHLLFYFIEFIRKKPLSIAAKSIGMYAGLIFLLAIMVLALNNDITRLTG